MKGIWIFTRKRAVFAVIFRYKEKNLPFVPCGQPLVPYTLVKSKNGSILRNELQQQEKWRVKMRTMKHVKTAKKKLGNRIVLGALMAMMVQATVVPVMAGNYLDTPFDFDFSGSDWQTTEERMKEDDTSVYMRCEWSATEGDCYAASVWGYSPSEDMEYSVGNGDYKFSAGTTRKLINWVYENDLEYAFIRAYQIGSGVGHFTGVWSPDSI